MTAGPFSAASPSAARGRTIQASGKSPGPAANSADEHFASFCRGQGRGGHAVADPQRAIGPLDECLSSATWPSARTRPTPCAMPASRDPVPPPARRRGPSLLLGRLYLDGRVTRGSCASGGFPTPSALYRESTRIHGGQIRPPHLYYLNRHPFVVRSFGNPLRGSAIGFVAGSPPHAEARGRGKPLLDGIVGRFSSHSKTGGCWL